MNESIREQIARFGMAPVVVTIDRSLSASNAKAPHKHFLKCATKTKLAGRGLAEKRTVSMLARGKGAGLPGAQLAAPRKVRHFKRLGVSVGHVDETGLQALERHPSCKGVYQPAELQLIHPVKATAAKASGTATWGLRKLQIQKLRAKGLTGKGVKIGHIDTGVDASHPALKGKIASFMEVDMEGDEVANAKAHDSAEHGTHTAGTLCGGPIDGTEIGVAPGAEIYSSLVIEGGQGLLRVLAGLEWVLENNVRVLNSSLGFTPYTAFFLEIVNTLKDQGVLPVFAIGNEGPFTSRSPGNYEPSLSVGAIDETTQIAPFSSSQYFNDRNEWTPYVLAPGDMVFSAKPGGGGQKLSGTSMATPHVAGVAALLFEAKPEATVDRVWSALTSTCVRLTTSQVWGFEYGVINPVEALSALESTST